MCGLSPRSLQHLQANTVGSNCPDTIPNSLKDLKWNPSAVAGKERASSHPSIGGKRAEKFRDAASMDWLEFTVECRGGTRPDVSQIFRFGCLLKMLSPLETRTHKFDVHAEDQTG